MYVCMSVTYNTERLHHLQMSNVCLRASVIKLPVVRKCEKYVNPITPTSCWVPIRSTWAGHMAYQSYLHGAKNSQTPAHHALTSCHGNTH